MIDPISAISIANSGITVTISPDYLLDGLTAGYVLLTLALAIIAFRSLRQTQSSLDLTRQQIELNKQQSQKASAASERHSQATIDAVNKQIAASERSARTAESTLQEMRIAREEENAPFVVVYFKYVHSRSTIYLVVENIGKTVAENVKMKFEPSLQGSKLRQRELENNTLLTHGIDSIVPNYKIPIPFDYLTSYLLENLPTEYRVTVTYDGRRNLPQQEVTYVLDLKPYKYTHFVTEKGLNEIDETLQRLESHFSNYTSNAESANSLLNHIANAINRGVVIKNRVSVSQDSTDIPTLLKEFVYLWVVDYGKQTEKWNKSFIFGLRAKAVLINDELLNSAVTFDSQAWAEQLKQVIRNLSKLGSLELVLDAPHGVMFSSLHFIGGSSKEEFDNLGDSIIADIRTVIELIDKEQETPLNGDHKEEAQPPISIEEANSLNGL